TGSRSGPNGSLRRKERHEQDRQVPRHPVRLAAADRRALQATLVEWARQPCLRPEGLWLGLGHQLRRARATAAAAVAGNALGYHAPPGGVAERSNAAVSKTVIRR